MGKHLDPALAKAIRNQTHPGDKFDKWARSRYHVGGRTLLARLAAGENGGSNKGVSSAGARGYTQFIPSTRREYINKYGVDPWKNAGSAIKATKIYLTHSRRGLADYNPGMPSYTNYILSQRVDPASRKLIQGKGARGRGGGGSRPGFPSPPSYKTVKHTIPGVDNSALRKQAKLDYLLNDKSPDALLTLASGLSAAQDVPSRSYKTTVASYKSPGNIRGGGGGKGKAPGAWALHHGLVKVAPGADRAGARTQNLTLRAVGRVAARLNRALTIGTGTNHNRMTVDGNVSDHWTGQAADIPMSGRALTHAGQQALIAFGMSPGQAKKIHGGLYTLQWHGHRVQVIFNTMQGGNHFTHLHVGIR